MTQPPRASGEGFVSGLEAARGPNGQAAGYIKHSSFSFRRTSASIFAAKAWPECRSLNNINE